MSDVFTEPTEEQIPPAKPEKPYTIGNDSHQREETARLIEVEPLFAAYVGIPGPEEEDLLGYVLDRLIPGAERKFFQVYQEWKCFDWGTEAENRALEAARSISVSLRAGKYQSGQHLSNVIGTVIKNFTFDAYRAAKRHKEEQQFPKVNSEDGDERDAPLAKSMIARIRTPHSDAKAEAEEIELLKVVEQQQRFDAVQRIEPYNFFNPLNNQLLHYMSPEDVTLVQTLEDFGGQRKEAAEFLGLKKNNLDQKILALGDEMGLLRVMVSAFQIPGEHSRLLAGRFDRFVRLLQGVRKIHLPITFTDAKAMAASVTLVAGASERTQQVAVRHLLKLWRAHTTN
jgi:hypothetical protein